MDDHNPVVEHHRDVGTHLVEPGEKPHWHRNEDGVLVKCYHKCRGLLTSWRFWCALFFGEIFSFPLGHLLWEKVPPFSNVSQWLGL